MKRCLTLLIVGSLLVMLLGAGASAAKPTIVVASKNFTEQVILGSIMKILLEENGFRVDDKLDLGGTSICRKALETGQIDVYMDPGLVYQAIKEKKVNVSMGFATDGRIEGFGLVNLIDDKQFFPVYNPAPVVRREVLDKYPEVGELLNKIGPLLDTKTMTRMNYLVDIEHKDASAVARDWLVSVGLIDK
ncbi:MAG: glycine betaine ABC transporter substrate-binding protein [Bacillota bacterium]